MLGRHEEKLAPALIQSTGAMQTGVCVLRYLGSATKHNSRLRKRLLRIGTTKVQRNILICKQYQHIPKTLIYFNLSKLHISPKSPPEQTDLGIFISLLIVFSNSLSVSTPFLKELGSTNDSLSTSFHSLKQRVFGKSEIIAGSPTLACYSPISGAETTEQLYLYI